MNGGFNAATDIFALGANWKVKGANLNASNSVAECRNGVNDTTHRDAHAERIAPSAEYSLAADVTSLPDLGTVLAIDDKKVMITRIVVNTARGAAPTLSVSGVQCETSATTKRTYSCGTVAISARHRAQDILGLLGSSVPDDLTSATFTFTVEPTVDAPKGEIATSDCGDGKLVAKFTHTSGTGTAPTLPKLNDTSSAISKPVGKTSPENDYVTFEYEVTKSLTGSEQGV